MHLIQIKNVCIFTPDKHNKSIIHAFIFKYFKHLYNDLTYIFNFNHPINFK